MVDMTKYLFLLFFGFCLNADAASPEAAFTAVWRDAETGALQWRGFDAAGSPLGAKSFSGAAPSDQSQASGERPPELFEQKTPLGSLWKLFVYLWLAENEISAPAYQCLGATGDSTDALQLHEEEAYCCEPGESIDRDKALVRSCGLFFSPERLGIGRDKWRDFWRARSSSASWLVDLTAMMPETEVTPAEVIAALQAAPPVAREEAMNILLARAFGPNGETDLVRQMGGLLRIKTFSWFRPGPSPGNGGERVRYGGGAGWLTDGTPVWFAGNGTGPQVMAKYARPLASALAAANTPLAPGCVQVQLFARHNLAHVQAKGGAPAAVGSLRGDYVAIFDNDVAIPFHSDGEIRLSHEGEHPRLDARLGLDEYVARVLDREADARETEAARALSVVIRTYLLNEAEQQGNCLAIEDSSHKQRVSPNAPSPSARAAAGFTTGLILAGSPVGYHREKMGENSLAWTEAVAASRAGKRWDGILRETFIRAELSAMKDPTGLKCKPFPLAEQWLAERAPRWNRTLREQIPGFELPPAPQICLLAYGNPFSEQDRNRIHLRALKTLEDRIALAHEYLHLCLARHPSGRDEGLIERWARKLAGELYELQ